MTVAEFYDWHDGTDTRYELVRGEPMAMATPSPRHAILVDNIHLAFSARLRPPCRSWLGVGVAHRDHDDQCRIPDVFVSCEPLPPRHFSSPRLIVEVLSPSTEKEDRTDKLDFYKSFGSVELILFVWQDKRRAELHSREGVRWPAQDFIGTGAVPLAMLDLSLSLDEIYAGLDLPTEASA